MHAPETDPDIAVVAYRRSLRASRARRARAALRRRRVFRGRGAALMATGLLAMGSAGAVAHEKVSGGKANRTAVGSATTIKAAQNVLGISADGIAGPQTRRAIKRFQRRNGLSVDGVVGPQTLKALGVTLPNKPAPTQPAAPADPAAVARQLAAIAQCESGGNLTAVSADGRYHGKYQFDQPTWERMGGAGDPAAAPEAEQDQRAAQMLATQGPGAWPNCA